jgi:GNAT superfamily N-acetyltransferase
MRIEACDPGSLEACTLVEELSATLAAITGDGGASSFAAADTRVPRSLFVIARDDDGALLGCGALRPLDKHTAEIKRVYARPGTHGVGAALLAHIEREAARFGYRQCWLETRKVNTARSPSMNTTAMFVFRTSASMSVAQKRFALPNRLLQASEPLGDAYVDAPATGR